MELIVKMDCLTRLFASKKWYNFWGIALTLGFIVQVVVLATGSFEKYSYGKVLPWMAINGGGVVALIYLLSVCVS